MLFGFKLLGHDVSVHEKITKYADDLAHDNSPGYEAFINTISDDFDFSAPKGITNALISGAGLEDSKNLPGDAGKLRSLNHFYDSIDTTYGKGLSDSPPDRRILVGRNSFA
jgi:hypothetical protein